MMSNWCKAGIHEACSKSMKSTTGKTFKCQCQHHVAEEMEQKAEDERKEARRASYRRTSSYDYDD